MVGLCLMLNCRDSQPLVDLLTSNHIIETDKLQNEVCWYLGQFSVCWKQTSCAKISWVCLSILRYLPMHHRCQVKMPDCESYPSWLNS